jgi:hypothetical protein
VWWVVTFARSIIDVTRPSAAVEAALGESPAAWVADLVDQVGRASADLLLSLGESASTHRFPVRDDVRVHRLILLRKDGPLLLPLSFGSSAPDAVFTSAEADLEAARRGAGLTRVELSARFTPNAGLAGDRRVLRWMTQDYTRRLGARIADHLLGSAAA